MPTTTILEALARSQRRSLTRIRDLKPEFLFGGHGAPLSGVANVQRELNASLAWLDTLENSVLEILRQKSPLRTIDATRAVWRKVYERAGVKSAEAREARDPRQYSVVSVNAMLLDLSRRGPDWEWLLSNPSTPAKRIVQAMALTSPAQA